MPTPAESRERAERNKFIRERILVNAHNARPQALSLHLLHLYLRNDGLYPEETETLAHVDYLIGAGFLALTAPAITPAARRWKITKEGTDHIETEGL